MKYLIVIIALALAGCGSTSEMVIGHPNTMHLVGEYKTYAAPCKWKATSPTDEYLIKSVYNPDGSTTCYVFHYIP